MVRELDGRWSTVCLRWLPPVGLTVCLAAMGLVPSFRRVLVYYGGLSLPFVLFAWTVVAWIVSITAHRQFVRNVWSVRPRHALMLGTLAGVALLLRDSVSPSLIPLFFVLVHVSLASERPRLTMVATGISATLTLALVEGLYALPLSVATLREMPGFHAIALRRYWSEIDLIQWNPECAQWDPELAYTLRPGACRFSNPGYDNEYRVNRLGVRDDQESLDQPDVVLLGDSHAMGMGVDQDETFANRLERMLGLKVLNTGVSSYGTARELEMLKRVDRSRARYLLIQYCSNDFEENREFIENGGRLPARGPEWFDMNVETNRRRRQYFAGKFTDSLLGFAWERLAANFVSRSYAGELHPELSGEALRYLLDVIEKHPVDLSGMKIIIFQMESFGSPHGWNQSRLEQLEQFLAAYPHNGRLTAAHFVDVTMGLGPEYFIPLDGHMNAMGHQRVAERLASVIH